MSILSCKTPNCPNYENLHNDDDISINSGVYYSSIGGGNSSSGGWRYSFSSSSILNNKNTELCAACKKAKKIERQKKTRSQILMNRGLMGKTTSILKPTAARDDDMNYQEFAANFERMNNGNGIGGGNKRSATVTTANNKTNRRISFAGLDGRVYMINNNGNKNLAINDHEEEEEDAYDSETNNECEKHSIYCECGGSGVGCQCSTKCFC